MGIDIVPAHHSVPVVDSIKGFANINIDIYISPARVNIPCIAADIGVFVSDVFIPGINVPVSTIDISICSTWIPASAVIAYSGIVASNIRVRRTHRRAVGRSLTSANCWLSILVNKIRD